MTILGLFKGEQVADSVISQGSIIQCQALCPSDKMSRGSIATVGTAARPPVELAEPGAGGDAADRREGGYCGDKLSATQSPFTAQAGLGCPKGALCPL